MSTNKKITQLDELTPATWADDDVIAIVDISAQETKKIQLSTFRTAVGGVASLSASTPLTVDTTTGDVTISVAISGGGTVNAVLDEDNMASNSPTALSTQQSIKAYVDSQIITVDSLSEVLALGNTTGGTNLIVSSGDVLTTNTINETTAASGVTIETVLIKDGEVVATGFTGTLDGVLGGGTPAAITGTALTLTTGATVTTVLDEDNMASNSATALATQQSIKAYVDAVENGDVVGPASSTDNAIVRFDSTTGKLLQNSTVIISDAGAVAAGSLTLTTDLAIADGGTGSSTAGAARTALGVDPAGTDNSTNVTLAGSLDYLTISGQAITRGAIVLSTDVSGTLPVANGGSGATSLTDGGILLGSGTGAITAMAVLANGEMIVGDGTTDPVAESGATLRSSIGVDAAGTDNSTNVTLAGSLDYLTLSGQEITRGAIVLTTDVSGTLPIANGGTNATSAGAALTALGAAARGANSDITSITGLTTDLTVAQGGTGAGTFAANGILYGNGTSAIAATAVGTDGHVLTSNGAGVAPTFQAAGGGGASDIDGLSDALTNSSGTTVGLGTGALAADDGSANHNTALGYQALNDATTAERNVAVGYQAMDSMTNGYGYSTAVGYQALGGATTGYNHVAIGYQALLSSTTGEGHTAVGRSAGSGAGATTNNSTFVGSLAGDSATGSYVTVVGQMAGREAGEGVVAVGAGALGDGTGTYNTAIGRNSLSASTTGATNTALGYLAGNTATTGTNNTLLGYDAEGSSATVSNEITLGNASIAELRVPGLNFNVVSSTATTGYVLTVDGSGKGAWAAAAAGGATDIDGLSDALTNSSGATIGLGTGALAADDGSTNKNTAVGFEALNDVTSGSLNVGFGHQAGDKITTASNSVALGAGSMGAVTTTSSNVAIGSRAMEKGTGSNNTFVGKSSGEGGAVASSTGNAAFGYGSLEKITSGGNNVAVGNQAGLNISTGGSNTMLGGNAGDAVTTGANNTVIGQNAAASSATVSNEITLGNASVTSFRIPGVDFYSLNGNVGIGTSAPSMRLHVVDGTSSLRFRQNGTVSETLLSGPSGGDAALYFGDTVDNVRGGLYYDTSANELQVRGYNNNTRMTVSSAGTVNVVGTFTAGTKTFRIDHPLPEKTDTHYLLHSSIEGPQADLIYRGRADLVSGVATVNIDTVSNMTEGTFDILCGNVQCFTSNEDGWTALKGSVTGNVLTITAQDNTCTDTVSWMVIGERKDSKMTESEWADNDGKLIVETLKNEH